MSSQSKIAGAQAPPRCVGPDQQSGRLDWELQPSAMTFDFDAGLGYGCSLTYKKASQGDRTGPVPFYFLGSKIGTRSTYQQARSNTLKMGSWDVEKPVVRSLLAKENAL
jgi:hypothetical protein